MYAEFLQALLAYVQALNEVEKTIPGADRMDSSMYPYPGAIPILLEDALVGFIVDEVGGVYQYREATEADRKWWDERPWKR